MSKLPTTYDGQAYEPYLPTTLDDKGPLDKYRLMLDHNPLQGSGALATEPVVHVAEPGWQLAGVCIGVFESWPANGGWPVTELKPTYYDSLG